MDRERLREGLAPASGGVGPLVQRDYWCVIDRCAMRPPELLAFVRRRFPELPPEEFAAFEPSGGDGAPLEVGDELRISIPGAGRVAVRVVHLDTNSLTVGTLQGHPIAGRITFGAYPNDRDDVIFHIRSRSRASSRLHYLGHLTVGDPMQSTTWTDFLDRLAHTVGEGVVGVIHEDEKEIQDDGDPDVSAISPTFTARGT